MQEKNEKIFMPPFNKDQGVTKPPSVGTLH